MIIVLIIAFIFIYYTLLRQERLSDLKNEFINNITHELKTPIATVQVALEALHDFKAIDNPQKSKEYLAISMTEISRLELLVDNVLKQSMLEKDAITTHRTPLDLSQLVKEVLLTLHVQLEQRDAKVNIDTEDGDYTILGDRLHLMSVLYNLIDNALKYSEAKLLLQIRLRKSFNYIELSVTDSGIGIPKVYQDKIFQPFFRVPNQVAWGYNQCKKRRKTRNHFYYSITRRMSIKVLYAEDEHFLGKIVKESLESRGYEVIMEEDGSRVVNTFINYQPDICVLDVMLPNKSGFEIAKEIRNCQIETPIIFLTAKTQTEDVVKGFSLGGNDYIRKPFSMEELIVRMDNLLSKTKVTHKEFEIIALGRFRFIQQRQVLEFEGVEKKLSYREAELLKFLYYNRQHVIDRRDLLNHIWGNDSFFNSRNLDVYITKLRGYLKDDPFVEIITIKGIGYRFVA
jgi:DNA-binding response OmpR family regulator